MDLEVDLEQIFNEAETALAPAQLLKDQPKNEAKDFSKAEICSDSGRYKTIYFRVKMINSARITAAGHMPNNTVKPRPPTAKR